MDGLEEKAKASGACQLVVKDLKEEFVKDFIFPCLRAGAVYERKYLLGTSMARPVIAKVKYKVDEYLTELSPSIPFFESVSLSILRTELFNFPSSLRMQCAYYASLHPMDVVKYLNARSVQEFSLYYCP